MERFGKIKPLRNKLIRGTLLAIFLFLSAFLMGCHHSGSAQLEHETSAIKSGLMEVTVCAQTEDDLLVPLTREVISGEDAAVSALSLLCATPENAMLLSGFGFTAPLPENIRLSHTFADTCMNISIEHPSLSEIKDLDTVIRAICNTALALPDVEQVQITHQGQIIALFSADTMKDASVSVPLNPLPLPVLSGESSAQAFTLYYPLLNSNFLVPVTTYLPTEPTAVTLTEALLKTEPPTGLENPFPSNVLLLFIEQTEDGLVLEFSEEIIPFALEQRENFNAALSSLWHTLRGMKPVKSLILSSGGYPFYTYVGQTVNQIP